MQFARPIALGTCGRGVGKLTRLAGQNHALVDVPSPDASYRARVLSMTELTGVRIVLEVGGLMGLFPGVRGRGEAGYPGEGILALCPSC